MANTTKLEYEAELKTQQAQEETRKLAQETRGLEAAAKRAAEALTKLNQSAMGRKTIRAAERYGADLKDASFNDFERLTTSRTEAGKMRRAFQSAYGVTEVSRPGQATRRPGTGQEPGSSFTDRAFSKLHEISDRLDPQRRGISTATGGLADMVSGGLGSSPAQTISGAGSVASGLLGMLGPVGRFAGGVIGGAAAGTAAGVALGIPGYREYMARLPSQEALGNRSALPQSFEGLGSVLTKLGHDLQMVGSEAGRLALSFAKVAGAADGGLVDRVRNAGLFGRSLGMDPSSAVTGFARAEYMGFGGSEAKQKQFANLLGKTIAEGGMMGNSEQVMEDMLKHIQGVEQNTGEMPSMAALGEYAELRAGLYQNPALKGPAGDSVIGGMTNILRGGDNGPKDALLMGAFGKEIGGSLTNLQWLRDANPFESVRSVTGEGSDGETIMDRLMAYTQTMAEQFTGDPADIRKKQAAMLGRIGGMNSHQVAAFQDAYSKMGNSNIGDVQQWLQGMGQSGDLSMGSIGNQIRLYNSRNDRGGLTTMADEYIKASNTSDADKKALEAAKGQGNEKLAAELARVIEATGTQNNEMRDHSQKMADLTNAMANGFGPSLRQLTDTMADLGMELVPYLEQALKELTGVISDLTPYVRDTFNWLKSKFGDGPAPTNEYESWTRDFENAHGDETSWFDRMDQFIGGGTNDLLERHARQPIRDHFGLEEGWFSKTFRPGKWMSDAWDKTKDVVAGPNGMVKVFKNGAQIFPEANATMGAGDYPGEGLQEPAYRTGGGLGGEKPGSKPAGKAKKYYGYYTPSGLHENLLGDPSFLAKISDAEKKYDIPPGYMQAIMAKESHGDPHAKSRADKDGKRAWGIAQMRNRTAQGLTKNYGIPIWKDGAVNMDPAVQVDAMGALLKEEYGRVGNWDDAAWAYHVGGNNVLDYRKDGKYSKHADAIDPNYKREVLANRDAILNGGKTVKAESQHQADASTSLPSNLITTGRYAGDVKGLDKFIAKHPDHWQAFMAATRNYPGKVRIHDAGRGPGETHNHQGFHALDYELERLDKPGSYIPNYQVSGKDFRAYEQFNQDTAAWGEHHYPGFMKRFRAGLYFGPSKSGKYWSDAMHQDMTPGAPQPSYGDLIHGAYPAMRERLRKLRGVDPISVGMGDPDDYYRRRFANEAPLTPSNKKRMAATAPKLKSPEKPQIPEYTPLPYGALSDANQLPSQATDPGMSRLPTFDGQTQPDLSSPGMARLPESMPNDGAFPHTANTGSGQAIPITATLNIHYSDGTSREHARQPIAKNVREPGYGRQVATFDMNHGLARS